MEFLGCDQTREVDRLLDRLRTCFHPTRAQQIASDGSSRNNPTTSIAAQGSGVPPTPSSYSEPQLWLA